MISKTLALKEILERTGYMTLKDLEEEVAWEGGENFCSYQRGVLDTYKAVEQVPEGKRDEKEGKVLNNEFP